MAVEADRESSIDLQGRWILGTPAWQWVLGGVPCLLLGIVVGVPVFLEGDSLVGGLFLFTAAAGMGTALYGLSVD